MKFAVFMVTTPCILVHSKDMSEEPTAFIFRLLQEMCTPIYTACSPSLK